MSVSAAPIDDGANEVHDRVDDPQARLQPRAAMNISPISVRPASATERAPVKLSAREGRRAAP